MVKIYLDPGHGGSDSGAIGNGIQEKDITLKIALRVKDILLKEYEGVFVNLSREDDTFPSLDQRTNEANAWGADLYISIHINAGGGIGFETFVYPKTDARTRAFQNVIHAEIVRDINMNDRGKKQGNYHVLRESNMAAVLTENGFIDNQSDAAKMKDPAWIEKVSRGHVNGIVKCFGSKKKEVQKNDHIYFETGGFSGDHLAKLHTFLQENKFWFSVKRKDDGTLLFDIGGFTQGNDNTLAMESFLVKNGYWFKKYQK